ncbi:MAG: glycyl-radical enzyme activating protein [Anaerolineae bacterium]
MTTGTVFDIKRFSIHDGPGIRTTVFLKGCPLCCSWCHNPEGQARRLELMIQPERCISCGVCQAVCENDAIINFGSDLHTERSRCTVCGACVEVCYAEARQIVGRSMTVTEVVDEIGRDVPFFDESGGGVTFSGGEPLSQPAFLRELLETCHERNLHTALDTCGYAAWDVLDHVREHVDLFLYDLKVMDDARHRQATGASNRPILKNLQRLARHGHRIILRVPVVPGINDDAENLRALGTFSSGLPSLECVELLSYHRIGLDKYRRLGKAFPTPEGELPTDEHVRDIAERVRASGVTVIVE